RIPGFCARRAIMQGRDWCCRSRPPLPVAIRVLPLRRHLDADVAIEVRTQRRQRRIWPSKHRAEAPQHRYPPRPERAPVRIQATEILGHEQELGRDHADDSLAGRAVYPALDEAPHKYCGALRRDPATSPIVDAT